MAKVYPSNLDDLRNQRLMTLAKEYTEKLQNFTDAMVDTSREIEKQIETHVSWPNYYKLYNVFESCQNLLPITRDLAQAISQHIEHGSLELFAKLEIRLILAELETAIRTAERLLFSSKIQHYIIESRVI